MQIVDFMTNTCGWGFQLCDGSNFGRYGSHKEQQLKFRAPHPLNFIAPHIMIELRPNAPLKKYIKNAGLENRPQRGTVRCLKR